LANVLLIGSGPLPAPGVTTLGFPQLRLSRFRAAMSEHRVTTVCLGVDVNPQDADWLDQLRRLGRDAEVVVSAGPYLPGMAACLIAGERPVWADLPGDPFAELQAAFMAGVVSDARHAAARAAALAVLSRADAISVISDHQRFALLGQLGVLDRLNQPPCVAVQPVAYDWPFDKHPPRSGPVIALSGGFNTWFDDTAAASLLEAALSAHPDLRVISTGGGIVGHYTEGAQRFAAWAAGSVHRDRITLHGWLPHERVPEVLSEASIGLILDVDGAEPLLGSRTRALMFAWLGIQIAATPGCALLNAMAAEDLILPLTGRVEDVPRLIQPPDPERTRRADAWLSARFSPANCFAPLLDWLDAPARTPAAPSTQTLVTANARLTEALARIHQSPTWRLLSPIHQVIQRLAGRR
jgi:hypothetical protein